MATNIPMEPIVEIQFRDVDNTIIICRTQERSESQQDSDANQQIITEADAASIDDQPVTNIPIVDVTDFIDDQTVANTATEDVTDSIDAKNVTTIATMDVSGDQTVENVFVTDLSVPNITMMVDSHDDQSVTNMTTVDITNLPGGQTITNVTTVQLTDCSVVDMGPRYTQQIFHDGKVVEDLPLHTYLWKIIRNSSLLEWITCIFVALTVIFGILIAVYHFNQVAKHAIEADEAASSWYVPRDMWNSVTYNDSIPLLYNPIKLVVIQHSVTATCYSHVQCLIEVFRMQEFYLENHRNADLPYNFLVGNDGRVYEGRGWQIESVSSRWLNRCLISIGFIGDYRYIQPTLQQLNRTKMLLEVGVRYGYLDPDYAVVGANDLMATNSPGTYLYEAIQEFDHYVHNNHFRRMACEQIHETEDNPFVDEAPHEWLITREDWGGHDFDGHNSTERFNPLRLVIINNFSTRDCFVFIVCRSQLLNLQGNSLLSHTVIQYNFMVGNDGRVYEARGWGVEGGDESLQFQPCAVNIGFFGDYTNSGSATMTRVSAAQISSTKKLLEEGVTRQYLHPDYLLVGARDIIPRFNPGEHLYDEIQTWQHYDKEHLLNMESTCDSLLY